MKYEDASVFTKSKMGMIAMKIKDWATRRVLAVVCIIVIVSILLIPWLKALLNETEGEGFIDTTSVINLSSEEDDEGKGMYQFNKLCNSIPKSTEAVLRCISI